MKRYTVEIIIECDELKAVEELWREIDEVISEGVPSYEGQMNVFLSYPQLVVEN